jgi:hypothetical protein
MDESLGPNPQPAEQKEQVGQKRASPAIEGIDLYLADHFFGRLYGPKLRPTMHIADLMYHTDIKKDTILHG